ncbi:hypothetical protein MVEN_01562600 [Mycena venus]|uniref:Zn(2)-C6 fungal-type domain-containing protein n=1 Tax=Mycena venus TaxID=2733690 RepID=A0A8H7CPL2_9AGAR|nr:hypothetical protein MVEN_01562600 [Mycena venus]
MDSSKSSVASGVPATGMPQQGWRPAPVPIPVGPNGPWGFGPYDGNYQLNQNQTRTPGVNNWDPTTQVPVIPIGRHNAQNPIHTTGRNTRDTAAPWYYPLQIQSAQVPPVAAGYPLPQPQYRTAEAPSQYQHQNPLTRSEPLFQAVNPFDASRWRRRGRQTQPRPTESTNEQPMYPAGPPPQPVLFGQPAPYWENGPTPGIIQPEMISVPFMPAENSYRRSQSRSRSQTPSSGWSYGQPLSAVAQPAQPATPPTPPTAPSAYYLPDAAMPFGLFGQPVGDGGDDDDLFPLTEAQKRLTRGRMHDPHVDAATDSRPIEIAPRSRPACARCKQLKVKCEFDTETGPCKRCSSGGHDCVTPGRKVRGSSPEREDEQAAKTWRLEEDLFGLGRWDRPVQREDPQGYSSTTRPTTRHSLSYSYPVPVLAPENAEDATRPPSRSKPLPPRPESLRHSPPRVVPASRSRSESLGALANWITPPISLASIAESMASSPSQVHEIPSEASSLRSSGSHSHSPRRPHSVRSQPPPSPQYTENKSAWHPFAIHPSYRPSLIKPSYANGGVSVGLPPPVTSSSVQSASTLLTVISTVTFVLLEYVPQ